MNREIIVWVITFVLLPLSLLLVSFFLCIPKLLHSLKKLEQTHKSVDFSQIVFWGALAVPFLLFVFFALMRVAIGYESYIYSDLLKMLIGIGLACLTFCFFVPRIYYFFKRWEDTKKAVYFSAMVFFGWVSLCCISLICLRFLALAVGV